MNPEPPTLPLRPWRSERKPEVLTLKMLSDLHMRNATHAVSQFNGHEDSGIVNPPVIYSGAAVIKMSKRIQQRIADICFNALNRECGGWEIDCGSHGSVTLHIASGRTEVEWHKGRRRWRKHQALKNPRSPTS